MKTTSRLAATAALVAVVGAAQANLVITTFSNWNGTTTGGQWGSNGATIAQSWVSPLTSDFDKARFITRTTSVGSNWVCDFGIGKFDPNTGVISNIIAQQLTVVADGQWQVLDWNPGAIGLTAGQTYAVFVHSSTATTGAEIAMIGSDVYSGGGFYSSPGLPGSPMTGSALDSAFEVEIVNAVPEPATVATLGFGLGGLIARKRRKGK